MFHYRQDVRSRSWSALIHRFSELPHVPRISRDLSYCSSLPRQHIVRAPYIAMRSLCRHGTRHNIKPEHLSPRQQIPGRHDNKPIDVSRRSEGYVPACASLSIAIRLLMTLRRTSQSTNHYSHIEQQSSLLHTKRRQHTELCPKD